MIGGRVRLARAANCWKLFPRVLTLLRNGLDCRATFKVKVADLESKNHQPVYGKDLEHEVLFQGFGTRGRNATGLLSKRLVTFALTSISGFQLRKFSNSQTRAPFILPLTVTLTNWASFGRVFTLTFALKSMIWNVRHQKPCFRCACKRR